MGLGRTHLRAPPQSGVRLRGAAEWQDARGPRVHGITWHAGLAPYRYGSALGSHSTLFHRRVKEQGLDGRQPRARAATRLTAWQRDERGIQQRHERNETESLK